MAGQSVERLAALSDSILAVAMTLLVLDVHVPVEQGVHSDRQLLAALAALAPRLLVYLMSFLMLGIIWVGQQTQINYLARSDRHVTWLHLAFLFAVTLMPFSTTLLGSYPHLRSALLVYWSNLFLLGALLYAAGVIRPGAACFKRILPLAPLLRP